MLNKLNNIGDEVYQSWNEAQRRDEIGKLVQGYRNGLPAAILCQLATSIAGGTELAKDHLAAFMSRKERKAIVKDHSGGSEELLALLKATLI